MKSKNKHAGLTYEQFRELAQDDSISRHEKVGFPNEYREGKENTIFHDICAKIPTLNRSNKTILEIGPGCSHLPALLTELCKKNSNNLLFVDSAEMLALLPEASNIEKLPGQYPDIPHLFDEYAGKIDIIIAYSVIQYVFTEGNLWDFVDRSLSLLSEGGEILFGDIPNITMRKRFFSSNTGIQCHRNYTGNNECPDVQFNQLELGQMDDSVVLSILSRVRSQGFHAWIIPQAADLPMANRREDILIRRP